MIKEFFADIDRAWGKGGGTRIGLKVIGSTALMLMYDYHRTTKDADIIEIGNMTDEIKDRLLKMAGKRSAFSKKYHLYLDIVSKSFPFLPPKPLFHPLHDFNTTLTNFSVDVLGVVDVVISKLGRFIATDIDDIEAMVKLGVVNPDVLEDRFRQAVEMWTVDARGEKLPEILNNLHTVQRDMLLVHESNIELPHWIERS